MLGTIRLVGNGVTYRVPAGQWLFVTNTGGVGGNNNNGLSLNNPSAATLVIEGGFVTNAGFYLSGTAAIILTNNGFLVVIGGQPRIDRDATLTQASGMYDHRVNLELAYDGTVPGAVAAMNFRGGSMLIRGNWSIGARETGVVNIDGGTVTNWATLTVGAKAPSFHGYATGILNIASGTLVHMRGLNVGDVVWTNQNRAQFTITGGQYQNISNINMVVGNSSTGALHVAGGSFVATNGALFVVGNNAVTNPWGVGYVTNSAGTMLLGNARLVRGQWVINGGTVEAGGALSLTNSDGALQFDSGRLTVGSLYVSNGNAFTVGDGVSSAVLTLRGHAVLNDGMTLNAGSVLLVLNTATHRLIGDISGNGRLWKLGSGWMTLDGANTCTAAAPPRRWAFWRQ